MNDPRMLNTQKTEPAPSGTRFRIHFATIGFEVQRIVAPAVALHADRAVLLTHSATDRARDSLEEVRTRLTKNKIRSLTVLCDIWDTSAVVGEIGGIVAAAPGQDYFFNVSTGPKTACIAGALAATFWNVRPYYQPVDYSRKALPGEGDHPVAGLPRFLTTFAAEPLDVPAMAALSFLVAEAGPVSKAGLLNHMTSSGIVKAKPTSKAVPQALHGQLDTILSRLEAWGFAKRLGRGRGTRIEVTPQGKGGYKMFHYLLYPKKLPPGLLD